MLELGPLIGAIDQGTSSTRFLVFKAENSELVSYHQMEVRRITPYEGWVEQDPMELYDSVVETIDMVCMKLNEIGVNCKDIKCVGLTNQRESVVVWDKNTGLPLYNCIVWLDNRTNDLVEQTLDKISGRDLNCFKDKTGLPISTYFSVFKLKWLIENVDSVKEAIANDTLMFGTVDSWLLWKLTGNHLTDVTNASRTLLLDIETLEWDLYLCDFFNIPTKILPKINSSADYYGIIMKGVLESIPITGVIGDQNAALVGQQCFSVGQTKITYGTGCFLIQNIGPGPINGTQNNISKEAKTKLVTTVAYKFGEHPACYALEGSIAIAGAAITWLRDNLELIQNYSEIEFHATKEKCTGGLYFVPAFQGLYAPHWDPNATGTLIGLSQFSKKCHIVRATLEGVVFQTNDILEMMYKHTSGIKIDGGMSNSQLLCQMLADISGFDIVRPKMTEATALGAAMVAGYHMKLWNIEQHSVSIPKQLLSNHYLNGHPNEELNESLISLIRTRTMSIGSMSRRRRVNNAKESALNCDIFYSNQDESNRLHKLCGWKEAVERSKKWIKVEKLEQKRVDYKRWSAIPFMAYVMVSFGTHIVSQSIQPFQLRFAYN